MLNRPQNINIDVQVRKDHILGKKRTLAWIKAFSKSCRTSLFVLGFRFFPKANLANFYDLKKIPQAKSKPRYSLWPCFSHSCICMDCREGIPERQPFPIKITMSQLTVLITNLSASLIYISVYLFIPKVYESFPYIRLRIIKIYMIERLGKITIVDKCVPIEKDGVCRLAPAGNSYLAVSHPELGLICLWQ